MAGRVLGAIGAPHHALGHEITMGASIGVVLAPQHGTSAGELMRNVDLALYSAKSPVAAPLLFSSRRLTTSIEPDHSAAGTPMAASL